MSLFPPQRVPSYACLLEDVMEETDSVGMDLTDDKQQEVPAPLQQQQQQQQHLLLPLHSMPRELTAARLALSSDIGMLLRSSHNNNNNNSFDKEVTKQQQQPSIKAAQALPMSRSFATPWAISVVRPSLSTTSLHSMYSARTGSFVSLKELEEDTTMMGEDAPSLCTEEEEDEVMMDVNTKVAPPKVFARTPTTACLVDMMDDVQIHILQFLPLADIRALMATQRQFRQLLFTKDAHVLWKECYKRLCHTSIDTSCLQHPLFQTNTGGNNNNNITSQEVLLVDDLSLPTAARPSAMTAELSNWHHQANLSLLLSMVQSQPTDIDQEQLTEYTTWRGRGRSTSRRVRTARTATTNATPLQCQYSHVYQRRVVQFTGRVGQGDRCVRSQIPLPRPALMTSREAHWVLPPNAGNSGSGRHNNNKSHKRSSSGGIHINTASLMDLFCRKGRAVSASRAAWRPFVAPFVSSSYDSRVAAVHLTPRFVSYFEVSILEPKTDHDGATTDTSNTTTSRGGSADCVAVGLGTESFDWHARMPGWDASSYGYHGDDGGIFHSSGGMLRKFGPSYGRGDVVGCGVDHVAGGIFFTLNGQFLGYAWTGLPDELLQEDLYPIVGVDTNDFVHCNFGTEPFVYNLKSMIVRHEDLVHQSLAASARASS